MVCFIHFNSQSKIINGHSVLLVKQVTEGRQRGMWVTALLYEVIQPSTVQDLFSGPLFDEPLDYVDNSPVSQPIT